MKKYWKKANVYLKKVMQKIKAYTLFEVTIAMLLSTICIAICYSAYDIISNYYKIYHDKNEQASNILAIKRVLSKDFNRYKLIIKNDTGLELKNDSSEIKYIINERNILREMPQHTDTFKVNSQNVVYSFEKRPALSGDTVDLITFNIWLQNNSVIPIYIQKQYSAENLFTK